MDTHTADVPKDAIDVDGEDEEADKPRKGFEVLSSAPVYHAFYGTAPSQSS